MTDLPDILVSDVHLTSQGCQRSAFNRLLSLLPGRVASLKIVGDLLDSTDESRLDEQDQWILHKLRVLPMPVTVLPGNHDPDANQLARLTGRTVVPNLSFASGGQNVYIEHGSRFDWAADWGWITRVGDAVGEWLHRCNMHTAADIDKIICKHLTGCYHNVHLGMVRTAKAWNDPICIAGHTHRAERHKDGYFNIGSFAIQRPTYILISNGVPTIREFCGVQL